MIVVTAPDALDSIDARGPSVFLAGSIEQDRAERWQDKVINLLSDRPIQIFNPRREDWDESWTQKISDPNFREQVEWELDALDFVDVIIVYFDKLTLSPVTLLELGLYASSGKLRVCCPDGFWRKGNVEIVCKRWNIPMYESLEDLVKSLS